MFLSSNRMSKNASRRDWLGYLLGQYMYFDGLGVAQDCVEAVRLFRLALAQGEADSQFTLA